MANQLHEFGVKRPFLPLGNTEGCEDLSTDLSRIESMVLGCPSALQCLHHLRSCCRRHLMSRFGWFLAIGKGGCIWIGTMAHQHSNDVGVAESDGLDDGCLASRDTTNTRDKAVVSGIVGGGFHINLFLYQLRSLRIDVCTSFNEEDENAHLILLHLCIILPGVFWTNDLVDSSLLCVLVETPFIVVSAV